MHLPELKTIEVLIGGGRNSNYERSQAYVKDLVNLNPQLQYLSIVVVDRSVTLNGILNMIGQCPSLQELCLKKPVSHCFLGQRSLSKFAKAFPSLSKIDLNLVRYNSANIVISIIRQVKSLKFLRFDGVDVPNQCRILREELGSEWQVSNDNSSIVLKLTAA